MSNFVIEFILVEGGCEVHKYFKSGGQAIKVRNLRIRLHYAANNLGLFSNRSLKQSTRCWKHSLTGEHKVQEYKCWYEFDN